jgi:hypothetical protein
MWLFDSIILLGAFHCGRFVGHFARRLRERFQEFVGSVVPLQKPPEILNVFAGPYRRRAVPVALVAIDGILNLTDS